MIQILNSTQIQQRIDRIAYQVLEDNANEHSIYIAGIVDTGYILAQRIQAALEKICSIQIHLLQLKIDKLGQANQHIHLSVESSELKNKVIIIVDDVLNSGKTLTYALRPFLDADVKKIRTILLIDRDHRRYPVHADFVGLRLSTTMKEHITVSLEAGEEKVFIS